MGCAESMPVESPAEVDRSGELLLEWRGSLGANQPVRFAPSSMTKWKIALVKATVDESYLQCTIASAVDRFGGGPTGGGAPANLCTVWCVPEVGAKSSSALALKVTGARGTWAQVGMCPPSTAHGDSLEGQKRHVAMSSGNDGRLHVNGIVKNYDLPKFDEGNDVLLVWRRSSPMWARCLLAFGLVRQRCPHGAGHFSLTSAGLGRSSGCAQGTWLQPESLTQPT